MYILYDLLLLHIISTQVRYERNIAVCNYVLWRYYSQNLSSVVVCRNLNQNEEKAIYKQKYASKYGDILVIVQITYLPI